MESDNIKNSDSKHKLLFKITIIRYQKLEIITNRKLLKMQSSLKNINVTDPILGLTIYTSSE